MREAVGPGLPPKPVLFPSVGGVWTPTLPISFACLLALFALGSQSHPCSLNCDLPTLGNTPACGSRTATLSLLRGRISQESLLETARTGEAGLHGPRAVWAEAGLISSPRSLGIVRLAATGHLSALQAAALTGPLSPQTRPWRPWVSESRAWAHCL